MRKVFIDSKYRLIIDEVKKTIDSILQQPYELILYGSVARGEATKSSDIDLLLLINGYVSFELKRLLIDSVYDIELKQDVLISLLIKSKEIWNTKYASLTLLYNNINREGLRV
jgi:uncharacterized protein